MLFFMSTMFRTLKYLNSSLKIYYCESLVRKYACLGVIGIHSIVLNLNANCDVVNGGEGG